MTWRMILSLFHAERDLPLGGGATSRFLAWIIGFMVILGALALAAAMLLSDVGGGWRAELSGRLSVQILPGPGDETAAAHQARAREVVEFLRRQPEVAAVRLLDDDRVAKLLEPWLGPRLPAELLPMPKLIDVELSSDGPVDTMALARRVAGVTPGITIDDHGVWLQRLLKLFGAIELAALSIVALIFLAAAATVVFTTRAGLDIHSETIELLHLVGAEDGYIARQFQAHALALALKGGAFGLALAIAALVAIETVARNAATGIIPELSLSVVQWLLLGCLPLFAALIATVTARMTVMRALGRMP